MVKLRRFQTESFADVVDCQDFDGIMVEGAAVEFVAADVVDYMFAVIIADAANRLGQAKWTIRNRESDPSH